METTSGAQRAGRLVTTFVKERVKERFYDIFPSNSNSLFHYVQSGIIPRNYKKDLPL
jgi:hypothetical protein